ncbi:hypothetical protein KIN20_004332, partial [Parelaphostrongylus tenuis]
MSGKLTAAPFMILVLVIATVLGCGVMSRGQGNGDFDVLEQQGSTAFLPDAIISAVLVSLGFRLIIIRWNVKELMLAKISVWR